MITDVFINVKYYPLKGTSLSYYLIINMIVLRIMNYECMGKFAPVTIVYKASKPIVIIKTKKKKKKHFYQHFIFLIILLFF